MSSNNGKPKRGRPPTYKFNKPDSELSENERRLKDAVMKRRMRQNRSYHEKKKQKQLEKQRLLSSGSSSTPLPSNPWSPPPQWTPPSSSSFPTHNVLDTRIPIPDDLMRFGELMQEEAMRTQATPPIYLRDLNHGMK